MTIVELIDVHDGFDVLTNAIRTRSKVGLLWLVALITFFLSAVLDNLTTAIVMVSILGKLIDDRRDRLFFAGMVILAANAGGAWSPIGDVTTTMLWMKDKISSVAVIQSLLLPSLVSLLVPVAVMSFLVRGKVNPPQNQDRGPDAVESQKRLISALGLGDKVGEPVVAPVEQDGPRFQKILILVLGVVGLLFVPVFKVLTHLPPFMGMMLSLSVLWIVTELMHKRSEMPERERFSPAKALERIDIPSMLFFMGILLAVGALQASGLLAEFAKWLDDTLPNRNMVAIAIGLVSAVVDNVPLVAGAIQMYDPGTYPELVTDHNFWHFLAFTAGTGGSILIIGSAAGVAVMGMERVEFFWYLKRITLLALLGYFAGAGVFLVMG
ncbi:MAG: sodium:proton antiporter NhaD [Bacteroidia bacterium]